MEDLTSRLTLIRNIAASNLETSQEKYKQQYDKIHRVSDAARFKILTIVWKNILNLPSFVEKKLSERYEGPFYISEIVGDPKNNTYLIKHCHTNKMWPNPINGAHLKIAHERREEEEERFTRGVIMEERPKNIVEMLDKIIECIRKDFSEMGKSKKLNLNAGYVMIGICMRNNWMETFSVSAEKQKDLCKIMGREAERIFKTQNIIKDERNDMQGEQGNVMERGTDEQQDKAIHPVDTSINLDNADSTKKDLEVLAENDVESPDEKNRQQNNKISEKNEINKNKKVRFSKINQVRIFKPENDKTEASGKK